MAFGVAPGALLKFNQDVSEHRRVQEHPRQQTYDSSPWYYEPESTVKQTKVCSQRDPGHGTNVRFSGCNARLRGTYLPRSGELSSELLMDYRSASLLSFTVSYHQQGIRFFTQVLPTQLATPSCQPEHLITPSCQPGNLITPSCQPEYYRMASGRPLLYDHGTFPCFGDPSGDWVPQLVTKCSRTGAYYHPLCLQSRYHTKNLYHSYTLSRYYGVHRTRGSVGPL